MKRAVLLGFLGLLATVLLAFGAAVTVALGSLPKKDGRLALPGLDRPVEILRDFNGVPHIYASSTGDATFALGFVHAQDRLWQMEMMRRLGAGRLAEVLGPKALFTDRFMRVLGLARLAVAQYEGLSEPVKRTLDAYAAGVNAFLSSGARLLPPEFWLTGTKPEPWKPTDSLLWGKIMGLRLSGNWRDELLRAQMMAAGITTRQLADLFPGQAANAYARTAAALPELPSAEALSRLAAALPATADPVRGASNAWAVTGAHTAGGKAILANDPHLGFEAPILWYLARIQTPELEVAGATVPGVPFMILGHNKRIAWGMSTTQSDTQDLFVERLAPTSEGTEGYLTPEGPRPFETRDETIKVRGEADVSLRVRITRHGPVISDVVGVGEQVAGEGRILALAAAFLTTADRTPEALYGINRAANWDEFVAALRNFHAPQQNVHYADAAGNIGFYAPGRVPVRRSGYGWLPAPGWSGEADWVGFIPFERLPHLFNPPAARLVSANNRIVAPDYPYYLGDDWAPEYRAQRIHRMLSEEKVHSLDTSARIQRDVLSQLAPALLPLMTTEQAADSTLAKVVVKLREWTGRMEARTPEPLIFSAWLRELMRLIFADELKDHFPAYWDIRPDVLAAILKDPRNPWCDDIATEGRESCPARVQLALEQAFKDLVRRSDTHFTRWRWGDEHVARFRNHVLAAMPLLGRLSSIETATDGGHDTINRGAFHVGDPERPFAHVHGPGFRALYDLSDLARSRFMIATGQSGHPLSGHYRDQVDPWRVGRYLRLGMSRPALESVAEGRLKLEPATP